ncbi:hypothetical protein J6590_029675 [Homalodisca vitripennis]|nr:hypothetical protein J6590_029675 [Homalodisca vitripennis]
MLQHNFNFCSRCSHSEVSRILSALESVAAEIKQPVDELILENNALPSLPGRAFSSLNVIRLMLRENGLQRVTANWLAGLESSLVELFIVEPELRSLPLESLESLPKLEAITLHAGAVTRLPRLANLTQLRYLHTRLPLLTELHTSKLQHMPALEQVHIVSSPLLSRLEQAMFDHLPKLMLLNITGSGVEYIHPRALTRLPSLVELSLAGNRIVDAGLIGRSIRELPSLSVLRLDENLIDKLPETTFVDIPPLREIHLARNYITEIHRGAFHRLPALRVLDLNENRLRKIHPEFFLQPFDSGLEELSVIHNELDDVNQLRIILEALPRLRFLDVSNNKLQDITYGSLRGHGYLERLHLDHNRLRRVVREAFIAMPALRELRLCNNSLSNYLEMPLWNLPALKGLDISYNEFHRLDRRMLANIPSLRRLDVSGNALVTVDAAAFLGTPALEHINISHNALHDFSPATFPHLTKLFELDVSDNRLRNMVPNLSPSLEYFHIARNHLPSMPSADVRLSALKYLDISGNGIHRLADNSFASMPLLKVILAGDNALQSLEDKTLEGLGRLETLDLRNNRLLSVNDRALRDLRRLNKLDLHGNRLDTIGPHLLRENTALKTLDLSWNQLTHIPESSLIENRGLEELILAHNALSELPPDLVHLRELRVLDLSHNRVSGVVPQLHAMAALIELNLAKNKLSSLSEGVFSNMPSLALLDLDSNELQYMAPHSIRSMPNLTAVRMGRNRLSTLPSAAFSSLPSLLSVELQENQLTDVASDAFTAVPSLLMLNLSYNQLTGLERAGLSGLHSLEVLDLSHNRVTRFDSHALPNLQSLVHLKMDDNRLCNIYGSPFRKMSRLRVLSLRNNKMTSLPEVTFKPLRHTMYSLDVEGNPLQCSCGLMWLQGWIREAPHLHMEPRCHDGSYLRHVRIGGEECSWLARQEETTSLGCEATSSENQSGYSSGVGPTQQLSSYFDSSSKETTIRPLPEESEYFYEDFVEYEENSTLPLNLSQYSSSTTESNLLQTIPPGVLSHFIPGDTPTLYAGTKSAVTTTTSSPSPSVYTRQPSSAFTFFGMPLPSLGSFWGSGRDTDGRGRFTSNRGRGRVQQLPPVLHEGFKPMLPGVAGGFKPIFNPFNKSEDYSSPSLAQESLYNRSEWNFSGNSLPHATISKVVSPAHKQKPPSNVSLSSSESVEEKNVSEPLLESGGGGVIVEGNAEETTTRPSTTTTTNEEMAFAISLTDSALGQHHPLTNAVDQKDKNNESEKTTTSSFLSDLWGSVSYVGKGNGPTSLSEFLAPGAQVPPKPAGRPTITKVTLTPPLGPGPAPLAEDLQAPIPRLAKSPPQHYYPHNDSMAWYYSNYNKSELEPYVGPGRVVPVSSSTVTVTTSLLNVVVTYSLLMFSV